MFFLCQTSWFFKLYQLHRSLPQLILMIAEAAWESFVLWTTIHRLQCSKKINCVSNDLTVTQCSVCHNFSRVSFWLGWGLTLFWRISSDWRTCRCSYLWLCCWFICGFVLQQPAELIHFLLWLWWRSMYSHSSCWGQTAVCFSHFFPTSEESVTCRNDLSESESCLRGFTNRSKRPQTWRLSGSHSVFSACIQIISTKTQ